MILTPAAAMPPLPEPFMELHRTIAPAVYEAWADQMRAYGLACYSAAIEAAAQMCDEKAADAWVEFKRGDSPMRGNPYLEGESDAAEELAAAIRAAKQGGRVT